MLNTSGSEKRSKNSVLSICVGNGVQRFLLVIAFVVVGLALPFWNRSWSATTLTAQAAGEYPASRPGSMKRGRPNEEPGSRSEPVHGDGNASITENNTEGIAAASVEPWEQGLRSWRNTAWLAQEQKASAGAPAPPVPPFVHSGGTDTTTKRYLFFNPLYPWYGLTNQLLCYSAAIRYGMESGRVVIFPEKDMPATFYQLFDLEKSQAELTRRFGLLTQLSSRTFQQTPSAAKTELGKPSAGQPSAPGKQQASGHFTTSVRGVAAESWALQPPELGKPQHVPASFLPPTSMNKKKLYLPERQVFHSNFDAQKELPTLAKIIQRSDGYAAVRHHNFFMRFPWVKEMEPPLDEKGIIKSLVFTSVIQLHAKCFWRTTLQSSSFVAVHLRLESDAKLIREHNAKEPAVEHLRAFFLTSVLPVANSVKAGFIFVCTGKPSERLLTLISEWNVGKETGKVPIVLRHGLNRGGVDRSAEKRQNSAAVATSRFSGKDVPDECSKVAPLPSAKGLQREFHRAKGVNGTQDHYGAAVDLLLLSAASAVFLPLYSTFKISVYSHRCDFHADFSLTMGLTQEESMFLRGNWGNGFPKGGGETSVATSNKPVVSQVRFPGAGVWGYNIRSSGDFGTPEYFSCEGESIVPAPKSWAGHLKWGRD
jgi:hypothetical protein